MKPSRLLSFLRNSFLFLEWTSAVFAVLLLVLGLLLAPYFVSTPGLTFDMPIYRLKFSLPPPLQPMRYDGVSTGTVVLQNIQGDLVVQQAANPSRLLTFVRMRTVSRCLLLILACAIFSLLRRLFDNVKQGEAFSFKSVRQIRGIGWCCLSYAAVTSLVFSVLDWLIARDLREHLTIGNLNTAFVAANEPGSMNFFLNEKHLSLNLTVLWIALLAFVFAEIFRQGMRLKQENDLTI